jgi:hypothetical protein
VIRAIHVDDHDAPIKFILPTTLRVMPPVPFGPVCDTRIAPPPRSPTVVDQLP